MGSADSMSSRVGYSKRAPLYPGPRTGAALVTAAPEKKPEDQHPEKAWKRTAQVRHAEERAGEEEPSFPPNEHTGEWKAPFFEG